MNETFTVCSHTVPHRTPELFAEYREPALPPGPAFIRVPSGWNEWSGQKRLHWMFGRVEGYIWQDATDHTPAGWVRPKDLQNNRTTERQLDDGGLDEQHDFCHPR